MEKTLKVLNKKLTDTETELKAVENKIGRGSHNYELVEQKIYDLQEDISATKNSIESGYVNLGRYGKYPAYKRAIPSFGNAKLETSEGFNDFDNILRVTKVANAYVKSTGSKST